MSHCPKCGCARHECECAERRLREIETSLSIEFLLKEVEQEIRYRVSLIFKSHGVLTSDNLEEKSIPELLIERDRLWAILTPAE